MTVNEVEQQILSLTIAEKAEVLQFLLSDFTAFWKESGRSANGIKKDSVHRQTSAQGDGTTLSLSEFAGLADQLAEEFAGMVDASTPILSDYAMSRAGIYEDHD